MHALACLALTLGLVGCGTQSAIPVNASQTLVMESSVLAAGIRASHPTMSHDEGQTFGEASVYNEKSHPVTLYYRFYWYNAKGLEMQPLEPLRSVEIPANSGRSLTAVKQDPTAQKVRLFLSVRSPSP